MSDSNRYCQVFVDEMSIEIGFMSVNGSIYRE